MNRQLRQIRERRVAAALRIALVAVLLALQIGLVVALALLLERRSAIVYALLQLAALAAAIAIYNRRGDAMYKLTWIILLLAAPVVGFILYLLWGGETQRRLLLRHAPPRRAEPEDFRAAEEQSYDNLRRVLPAWAHLAESLRRRDFPVYQNTRVHYFPEGKLLLDDLLLRCRQAERFIFLEYFILAEGRVWDALGAMLREKARAGVEVRVIFDDFGNIRRFSAKQLGKLRAAGVSVLIFNPVQRYVNRLYFNYRDHRKIAVIDGEVAYTGGVNVADEYANLIERFGYWKDSGVRLEGEGVWGLTSAFLDMWGVLGGETRRGREHYRPLRQPRCDGWCQPFTDGPVNNPDNPAEDAVLQLIAGARRSLYLTTPYFIPDDTLMRALCLAGDGGVDVRLMLPGIPDHKFTDLVADSHLEELLDHGVKVYRYTPGFLHGKSIAADRRVAMIGSVNLDYRSFQLHHEDAVLLYDCPAIEDLLTDMEQIMAQSRRVTAEELKGRKWYRRLAEPFLRLFAIWM